MVRWHSVLSHAVYGGVGIYTTGMTIIDAPGPGNVSFSILILRSLTGMLHAATDEDNSDIKNVYEFVDKLAWFFAFPFYAAHLWMKYETKPEYAYIHPAVAVIPFGLYLADKDYDDAAAALMLGNAISASYITIVNENWFGLGATAVFAATHGVVKIETEDNDVCTKDDAFNYLLAVYMLLAWHAW